MKILKSIKKLVKTIMSFMWLIELIIAFVGLFLAYFAVFIAYPEYKEYISKNNIPDINGNWQIEFTIEESSYEKYNGMTDKYNIFFIGAKDEYKGKGEKYESWGNFIQHKYRDKFEIDLVIKNNNMYGLFDLYGKERKTDGNINVVLNEEGTSFSGTFIGNAADSKGFVKGIKIN